MSSNTDFVSQSVLEVPTWVEENSYLAQTYMRRRCAEAAAKAVAQMEQTAWQTVTTNADQPSTLPNDPIIEDLAAYAHEAWAGWMRYMLHFGTTNGDGTFTMNADKVTRWKRQMSTEYADLPEKMKDAHRDEARKILAILFPQPPVELPF